MKQIKSCDQAVKSLLFANAACSENDHRRPAPYVRPVRATTRGRRAIFPAVPQVAIGSTADLSSNGFGSSLSAGAHQTRSLRAGGGSATGGALATGIQGSRRIAHGFDPSDEAVRIARKNAETTGATLRAVVARDDQFDFGSEQWDLIVMTFVRTPTTTDTDKFWQSLKPGGLVVYEDGADDDHSVLDAFHRFRIRFFEDVEDKEDWNPQVVSRHQRFSGGITKASIGLRHSYSCSFVSIRGPIQISKLIRSHAV